MIIAKTPFTWHHFKLFGSIDSSEYELKSDEMIDRMLLQIKKKSSIENQRVEQREINATV